MRRVGQTRNPQHLLLLALPNVAPVVTAGVVVVWAARDGGFPSASWYPGATLIGLLLAVQLLGGVLDLSPSLTAGAVLGLSGYGAVQLASIIWASSQGSAWDAANRTFAYAFIFAIFAGWRAPPVVKEAVALGMALALAVVGVGILFSAASHPASSFILDRLAQPTGYANATAALFLIPFWLAVAFAGDNRRAPLVRGLALGAAATLLEVAYVPESRGSAYAFPVVALVLLGISRNRIRTGIALALAVAPTALLIHPLTHPFDAPTDAVRSHATHQAAVLAATSGLALAAVGGVLAVLDRRFDLGTPSWIWRVRTGVAALVIAGLATAAIFFSPTHELHRAWMSFKAPQASGGAGGSRLLGNLGSNRYDFWRVSLDLARNHPLGGVGADNFGADYLQHRRSHEEPEYPHSVELSVLAETGAFGAVAFASFAGLAGAAVVRARRRTPQAAALIAGGATACFYWLLHGSVDWLWEFPALGGTALLLLGLAVGARHGRRGPAPRLAVVIPCAVIVVAVTIAFVGPWSSARDTAHAANVWNSDPPLAFALLDRAARLNPLSDTPHVMAMTIASELGDAGRMQTAATAAVDRNPRNWFSRLQLAVALSHNGLAGPAVRQATTAQQLNPSEPLIDRVLDAIRQRRPLGLNAVDVAVAARLVTIDPQLESRRRSG